MKSPFKSLLILLICVSNLTVYCQDTDWPRKLSREGSTLVMYQPQVDDWMNFSSLDFRMAFTLDSAGSEPAVGVMSIIGVTDVNTDSHRVLIHDFQIQKVYFSPEYRASAEKLEKMVRSFFPQGHTVSISLDQIVACVPKKKISSSVNVKNDPPVIIVSYNPSLLLQVDGKAVHANIPNTDLSFVVNTTFPLFLDKKSSRYYLFDDEEWLTSVALEGPWTMTAKLPTDMSKLVRDSSWVRLKKFIPPQVNPKAKPPVVYYCDKPAEMIVFKGQPVFSSIPGISLTYATNTTDDVFLDTTDKNFYCLLSGRWFRSLSLDGPWSYATPDLPADFAKIPYTSSAARVLVLVPGTEEASDAVLIAQIPTSIVVDPGKAPDNVKVSYYGSPQFQPVETTPMSYAVNTPDKVIRVDDRYYLCFQGIWFLSVSPEGPWQTVTTVPPIIYTIPPSSPVYNVTYVTQTLTSNGYVQASYTAGYMGACIVVAGGGVVITSGTGYYYPPVYYYPPFGYPVYCPYPVTYGYAACTYHPYEGACYSASFNPATGTYARGATVYGPYGSASVGKAYNPYTGTMARGASVSTPNGTAGNAMAYNPKTGARAQTKQSSNPYSQWGSSTVTNSRGKTAVMGHSSTVNGTHVGVATSAGEKAVAGEGTNGSGGVAKNSSGDLYAAKDGKVYTNTGGSWSQVTGVPSQSQSVKDQSKISQSIQNQESRTNESKPPTSEKMAPRPQGTETQVPKSAGTQSVEHPASGKPQPSSQDRTGGGSIDKPQGSGIQSENLDKEMQNRQRGSFQSQQYQGGSNKYGGGGGRRR